MRKETLTRLRGLGFATYTEYLASDLWASNKRRLKLPKQCWVCGAHFSLHAHHCSYENIGNEQDGDLIVLCAKHHKAAHRATRRKRNPVPLDTAHIAVKMAYNKSQAATPVAKPKAKKRKKKLTPAQRRKQLESKMRRQREAEAKKNFVPFRPPVGGGLPIKKVKK